MTKEQLQAATKLNFHIERLKGKEKNIESFTECNVRTVNINDWDLEIEYVPVEVLLTLYRAALRREINNLEKQFEAMPVEDNG